MPVSFLQKDKGGDLTYEAPERWDASPAPTVTLYDPTGGELVASQAATLGPSTTLDGAAAAGQTTIPLTATTGISVGDELTVENSSGQSERVTVAAVSSGVSITVRDELQYTYASSDTCESTRLSVTVSAAQAEASHRNCYARWAYSVGSQAQIDTTLFHISVWAPRLNLDEQDILRREPRAVQILGTRQRLSDLIEDVWVNEILEELGQACDPGALLSGEALRMATLYRTLAEIWLANQDHEQMDRCMDLYRGAWERVLQQTPVDVDQSGTVSDDDLVSPAWTGRLYRA